MPSGEKRAEPSWPGTDSGLLSPVRADSPVEALVADEAWLQAMLDAEAALARAQARLGAVPPAVAATITDSARAERFDLADLAHRSRAAANPVVGLVNRLTAAVAETDPAAAGYVHRGSTSQDIMDTGLMLVAARALREIVSAVDRVVDALARLAAEHRGTPMVGRTLTQHAVPITFGLKAAGWLQGVLQARRRLRQLLDDGLPVQLGGAAGTLAGYLEYRSDTAAGDYATALIAAFAEETGLSEPALPWHTVRTPIAELGSALALLTGALGKIAVDVQSLARTEVAELAEPAEPKRGVSSAMPHKRNPVLAALIRSAAVQLPALAAVLAGCMLAEDERPAGLWQAEWQPVRDCLRLAGGAAHVAAELTEGLVVYPDRMSANLMLTGGLVVSERVVAVLTPTLGARAARELMDQSCAQAVEQGRPLRDVLAGRAELDGLDTVADLDTLLDPAGYLGAADTLVERALHRYRAEADPR